MRTLRYLLTLVVATIWYGGKSVLAAWFRVPRVPGGCYDRAGRGWARALLSAAGVTATVEGTEHLSATGPQIVAANHQSLFDILAVLGYLPLPVKFVAKKELFRIPLYGAALRAAGHVRLDRRKYREAFDTYAEAARSLVAGKLTMVVFPEGTRSRTGELLPFKTGPFVLAIESGAQVIPAYIGGSFGIQRKGSIRVRPRPIRIVLGAPIATQGLTLDDREVLMRRTREAIETLKRCVDGAGAPA